MRYSPPHSRGGDNPDAAVQNYVRYVAGRMGISPDAPIDVIGESVVSFGLGWKGRGGRLRAGRGGDDHDHHEGDDDHHDGGDDLLEVCETYVGALRVAGAQRDECRIECKELRR